MRSKRALFKWFAMTVITAMLLQFAVVLPSASAQGEEPPTPTETATQEPTATPVEATPTESPTPVSTATDEGEPVEIPSSFVGGEAEPALQPFWADSGRGADFAWHCARHGETR